MNFIATSEHRSNYPRPIAFEPGDLLKLGEADSEYPGWVWVTTPDGNQGWAPEQYLAVHENSLEASANQSYSAYELDTQVGERLEVLQELNQWVLVRNSTGNIGWVPRETTTPV